MDFDYVVELNSGMDTHLTSDRERRFDDNFQILNSSQSAVGRKAMVFSDSYSLFLYDFLSRPFAETRFLWRYNLTPRLIASERPDVLIQESGRRNILAKFDSNPVGIAGFRDPRRLCSRLELLLPPWTREVVFGITIDDDIVNPDAIQLYVNGDLVKRRTVTGRVSFLKYNLENLGASDQPLETALLFYTEPKIRSQRMAGSTVPIDIHITNSNHAMFARLIVNGQDLPWKSGINIYQFNRRAVLQRFRSISERIEPRFMADRVSRTLNDLESEAGFAIVFAKFHHLQNLPVEVRRALNEISTGHSNTPDSTHFALLLDLPDFRLISAVRDGETLSFGANPEVNPVATVVLKSIDPEEPDGFGLKEAQ
jgi:hypothetical protein